MIHLGKYMVITGGFLIVFGVILMVAGRFNISIGSLPGDITYHKRNITVFSPFGTMLVVSIILTLIANVISKWKN